MRETKFTYDLVAQCVELKRDGLCDADIIAAIGVHPSTFYRWLKDGEEAKTGVKRALYDELKKAESEYKRNLLTTIKSAAESRAQFWTAAAWPLERKYPMEYGNLTTAASVTVVENTVTTAIDDLDELSEVDF